MSDNSNGDLIDKIKNQIIDFGDGKMEFETIEISALINHIRNLEVEKMMLLRVLFEKKGIIQKFIKEMKGLDNE